MCYGTGKYTLCRRVRPSFSPEILQARAVKGLIVLSVQCVCFLGWGLCLYGIGLRVMFFGGRSGMTLLG